MTYKIWSNESMYLRISSFYLPRALSRSRTEKDSVLKVVNLKPSAFRDLRYKLPNRTRITGLSDI